MFVKEPLGPMAHIRSTAWRHSLMSLAAKCVSSSWCSFLISAIFSAVNWLAAARRSSNEGSLETRCIILRSSKCLSRQSTTSCGNGLAWTHIQYCLLAVYASIRPVFSFNLADLRSSVFSSLDRVATMSCDASELS